MEKWILNVCFEKKEISNMHKSYSNTKKRKKSPVGFGKSEAEDTRWCPWPVQNPLHTNKKWTCVNDDWEIWTCKKCDWQWKHNGKWNCEYVLKQTYHHAVERSFGRATPAIQASSTCFSHRARSECNSKASCVLRNGVAIQYRKKMTSKCNRLFTVKTLWRSTSMWLHQSSPWC